MRGKVWFILPLLAALIVGAAFAGCVGSGSSHSTPTPTATATATPTATPTPTPKGGGPTPIPPPTGTPRPTPTPHPSKALVGFVIGFKVINASYSKDGGKTWINANEDCPLLLMVQTYLILPNGTKVFMLVPYEKNYGCDCFYVIGFNRTQGWHGANYNKYKLPFWGNTTFFFSTVWSNKTFYQKILPLLMKGAKIELKMGLSFPGANLNNFTQAVKFLTEANPLPLMYLNWTPGQNLTKVFVYAWTVNEKGVSDYGYKCKAYVEIWIKPVYAPWGMYPPALEVPWVVPGNDYDVNI